jgi:hypothetical protein
MKIKKVDKRFKGWPRFKYCVDLPRAGNANFFAIREWAWDTFGASKEIDAFFIDFKYNEHENNSHNDKWTWHYDEWTRRVYFKSDKEANWFTLKWI